MARTLFQPIFLSPGPICGADSCCGAATENNLKQFNRLYLEKYLRGSINKVSSLIETRAKKFDGKLLVL